MFDLYQLGSIIGSQEENLRISEAPETKLYMVVLSSSSPKFSTARMDCLAMLILPSFSEKVPNIFLNANCTAQARIHVVFGPRTARLAEIRY